MKTRLSLIAPLAILLASCAPSSAPIVAPAAPQPGERYLIDPRIGFEGQPSPANARRFDEAWRAIMAGDDITARKRLDDIRAKEPGYVPAQLAEAAIALKKGRLDEARPIVQRILAKRPQYTAAEIYAAEIAMKEGRTRDAYNLYRDVASHPGAPAFAGERTAELRTAMFDETYKAALGAPDQEAVRLLREALAINPSATPARILLVQKLMAEHDYASARAELEPILNTADVDRTEVQEALAEIDINAGRYEAAIARYERLSKREPRFSARLEEIKQQYAEANMPPQFRRAIESESITRGDLAVLMYWKVAAVRFASNMAAPPIAIDISETPGRDEIVRAMALGIYQVDPVTRRVGPYSPVNAGSLARIAARVLALRGAACAHGAGNDPQRVLSACAIVDPSLGAGNDAPISGREAAEVMEQVDRALK
jgi:tetratricopeptide (TPR) repeat protein